MSTEDEIQILYYSHLIEVVGCHPMIAAATATDAQREEALKRTEDQIKKANEKPETGCCPTCKRPL